MSDTYRDVLSLRVVRRFLDEPVGADEVAALLGAARWTGSSKNRQGWAFVVIEDEADRERVAAAGSFSGPVRAAPLTIALVRTPDGNDFDIGRVAQNVMLAAAARGIGSCPVTLHDQSAARSALRLPSGYECRWVIALGYPDPEAEREQRAERRRAGMSGRKPLAALVHRGTWGGGGPEA
jgi:nitroreductase